MTLISFYRLQHLLTAHMPCGVYQKFECDSALFVLGDMKSVHDLDEAYPAGNLIQQSHRSVQLNSSPSHLGGVAPYFHKKAELQLL